MKRDKDEQLAGQMSIFDIMPKDEDPKPCEYSFQRYVGQRVQLSNGEYGKIMTIEDYYTTVEGDNGRYMIGTPSTMYPVEDGTDLENMDELDMVSRISEELEKVFAKVVHIYGNKKTVEYKCKVPGGLVLTIDGFSRYDTEDEFDGKRMILVGYDDKKNHSGGGGPCDSIDEAVEYFQNILRRYDRQKTIKQWLKDAGFEQYANDCEYCFWKGYGLRREEQGKLVCEWQRKTANAFKCTDHSRWLPNTRKIPKLCGNCVHANMFHDEDERGEPLDWPEIYCTLDDEDLERSMPYINHCRAHKPDQWHENYEFATCPMWRSDGWHLRKEEGENGNK